MYFYSSVILAFGPYINVSNGHLLLQFLRLLHFMLTIISIIETLT